MRLAVITALEMFTVIGGIFTIAMAGVKLQIDRGMESYFIEVEPTFDREALRAMSSLADSLGYEVMPRWECPPEEMPSGALRHWLVEKEVVYDRAFQAV